MNKAEIRLIQVTAMKDIYSYTLGCIESCKYDIEYNSEAIEENRERLQQDNPDKDYSDYHDEWREENINNLKVKIEAFQEIANKIFKMM